MQSAMFQPLRRSRVFIGLQEAAEKISTAAREVAVGPSRAEGWLQRVIYREVENRARERNAAYWDEVFAGRPHQRPVPSGREVDVLQEAGDSVAVPL